MTTSKSSPTDVVVVDGSNIATEGRSMPSLSQLNDAVMAFKEENPDAVITVVVDATFGHRIDKKEAKEFDLAVAHNELVAPPAGAIGRGDAFVLSIANKVGARILSNDSFQEFHGDYPWLFDEGRLIGGKPVPYVGWVFVERLPVKGPVSRKSQRAARGSRGEQKTVRRSASREASLPMPVPSAPPPGAARRAADQREQPVAPQAPAPVTATAGAPVNDLLTFLDFVEHHPVGSSVNGVVDSYSSHGAYVKLGDLRGYVPLRLMSDPPPRSAREVMHIGDAVTLVVTSFAPARRSVDLTVPHMAPGAAVVATPEVEVIAEVLAPEPDRQQPKRSTKRAAAAAEEPAPAAPAPAKRAGRKRAAPVSEQPAPAAPAPAKRAVRKKAALPPPEVALPADGVTPTEEPRPPVPPAPPEEAPAARPARKAPATKTAATPTAKTKKEKAPATKAATKRPAKKATTPAPEAAGAAEPERPAKKAAPKKAAAKKAAAKKTPSLRPTTTGLPADAAEPATPDGDAPPAVKRSRARKTAAST